MQGIEGVRYEIGKSSIKNSEVNQLDLFKEERKLTQWAVYELDGEYYRCAEIVMDEETGEILLGKFHRMYTPKIMKYCYGLVGCGIMQDPAIISSRIPELKLVEEQHNSRP